MWNWSHCIEWSHLWCLTYEKDQNSRKFSLLDYNMFFSSLGMYSQAEPWPKRVYFSCCITHLISLTSLITMIWWQRWYRLLVIGRPLVEVLELTVDVWNWFKWGFQKVFVRDGYLLAEKKLWCEAIWWTNMASCGESGSRPCSWRQSCCHPEHCWKTLW